MNCVNTILLLLKMPSTQELIQYFLNNEEQLIHKLCHEDELSDPDRLEEIYDAVVEANNPNACRILGDIYIYGIILNIERGLHLIHMSADMGNSEAQHQLSMYYCGNMIGTIERDPTKIIHYLELSAKQGHREAIWKLGGLYSEGFYGIERDLKKAVYYLQIGIKAGISGSRKKMIQLMKDCPEEMWNFFIDENEGLEKQIEDRDEKMEESRKRIKQLEEEIVELKYRPCRYRR